jgi:hypothetical protein
MTRELRVAKIKEVSGVYYQLQEFKEPAMLDKAVNIQGKWTPVLIGSLEVNSTSMEELVSLVDTLSTLQKSSGSEVVHTF